MILKNINAGTWSMEEYFRRFKVVQSCKVIVTVVLAGWSVRCAAYFTNMMGGRSYFSKWSKPSFVTDIYTQQ